MMPHMSDSYTMRGLDPKFWRRVKVLAALNGVTVKDLIVGLLKKALA